MIGCVPTRSWHPSTQYCNKIDWTDNLSNFCRINILIVAQNIGQQIKSLIRALGRKYSSDDLTWYLWLFAFRNIDNPSKEQNSFLSAAHLDFLASHCQWKLTFCWLMICSSLLDKINYSPVKMWSQNVELNILMWQLRRWFKIRCKLYGVQAHFIRSELVQGINNVLRTKSRNFIRYVEGQNMQIQMWDVWGEKLHNLELTETDTEKSTCIDLGQLQSTFPSFFVSK